MGKRILLIQGHPDAKDGHFVQALAGAYEDGALMEGHSVQRIDLGKLDVVPLRSAAEWQWREPSREIVRAQRALLDAEHVVVVFPLWMGDMPALLKAFFEQLLRPGFAIGKARRGRLPRALLKGRSARIVVTMGMPAFFYRTYYRAHSVKSLKRNILESCGISPVRTTLIGLVDGKREARGQWLERMRALGRKAG